MKAQLMSLVLATSFISTQVLAGELTASCESKIKLAAKQSILKMIVETKIQSQNDEAKTGILSDDQRYIILNPKAVSILAEQKDDSLRVTIAAAQNYYIVWFTNPENCQNAKLITKQKPYVYPRVIEDSAGLGE